MSWFWKHPRLAEGVFKQAGLVDPMGWMESFPFILQVDVWELGSRGGLPTPLRTSPRLSCLCCACCKNTQPTHEAPMLCASPPSACLTPASLGFTRSEKCWQLSIGLGLFPKVARLRQGSLFTHCVLTESLLVTSVWLPVPQHLCLFAGLCGVFDFFF